MQIKALGRPAFYAREGGRPALTKTMLAMKLTGILLLATVLQVSARSNAQTVTYAAEKVALPTVFAAIEQQTGYVFFTTTAICKAWCR